jgi:membrane-associated phospholipid phosphatase
VSAVRLIVGIIVMGIAVPIILFLLLDLHTINELLVVFATTFLAWGVTDLLATILEKPRLRDRSPGRAIKDFNPERSEGSTENPR